MTLPSVMTLVARAVKVRAKYSHFVMMGKNFFGIYEVDCSNCGDVELIAKVDALKEWVLGKSETYIARSESNHTDFVGSIASFS